MTTHLSNLFHSFHDVCMCTCVTIGVFINVCIYTYVYVLHVYFIILSEPLGRSSEHASTLLLNTSVPASLDKDHVCRDHHPVLEAYYGCSL